MVHLTDAEKCAISLHEKTIAFLSYTGKTEAFLPHEIQA